MSYECLLDSFSYDFRESDKKLFVSKIEAIKSVPLIFGGEGYGKIIYSSESLYELVQGGAWPNIGMIKGLINKFGIEDFSVKEIAGIINEVFKRSPAIEDLLVNGEELTHISFGGDEDSLLWDQKKKDLLERAYSKFSIYSHLNIESSHGSYVLGHPGCGAEVNCSIKYSWLDDNGDIVESAGNTILALCEPNELLSPPLDAFELWRNAQNEEEVFAAIKVGVESSSNRPRYTYSVGANFFPSLTCNQCFQVQPFSSVAYKRILKLITLGALVGDKEMRDGAGNQITKDGFEARRGHITKGNPALRLMYWKKNDEIILANIGPKNEMVIESAT